MILNKKYIRAIGIKTEYYLNGFRDLWCFYTLFNILKLWVGRHEEDWIFVNPWVVQRKIEYKKWLENHINEGKIILLKIDFFPVWWFYRWLILEIVKKLEQWFEYWCWKWTTLFEFGKFEIFKRMNWFVTIINNVFRFYSDDNRFNLWISFAITITSLIMIKIHVIEFQHNISGQIYNIMNIYVSLYID